MGTGNGHLSPVFAPLSMLAYPRWLLYPVALLSFLPLGSHLFVSLVCYVPPPCRLQKTATPISSDAPVPTLRPKFLGLGNWNTFASVSSYSSPPSLTARSLPR